MNGNAAKKWAGAIGAVGVLSMSLLASAPATADDGTTGVTAKAPSADRIVDRTTETMPMDGAAVQALRTQQRSFLASASSELPDTRSVTVNSMTSIPDAAGLKPGQSVQVNYKDGVVVERAITATCSVKDSVQTPYKDGGYAWSYHNYGRSAGCSGSVTVVALLSSYAAPSWHYRDREEETTAPNQTTYWATDAKCKNTSTQKWHSENAIGSSTTSLSPDKNLACAI